MNNTNLLPTPEMEFPMVGDYEFPLDEKESGGKYNNSDSNPRKRKRNDNKGQKQMSLDSMFSKMGREKKSRKEASELELEPRLDSDETFDNEFGLGEFGADMGGSVPEFIIPEIDDPQLDIPLYRRIMNLLLSLNLKKKSLEKRNLNINGFNLVLKAQTKKLVFAYQYFFRVPSLFTRRD